MKEDVRVKTYKKGTKTLKVLKPGTVRLRRALQKVFNKGPRNAISGRTLIGKSIAVWPRNKGFVHNNNRFNLNTFVQLKNHPYSRRKFNFGNVTYLNSKRKELPLNHKLFYDLLFYYHTLPERNQNGFTQLILNNNQRQSFQKWIASKYPNITLTPNVLSRAVNLLRGQMNYTNNNMNSVSSNF